jgi:hypothetical protein
MRIFIFKQTFFATDLLRRWLAKAGRLRPAVKKTVQLLIKVFRVHTESPMRG